MATTYLSPVFGAGAQLFDNKGVILVGGSINTFVAGTTTPVATFTDSTGNTPNGITLALDAYGRPPQEIWLGAGVAVKFIVRDSTGVQIGIAYDFVSGVNDPSAAVAPNSEWIASGLLPSFISSVSFSLPGDQRAKFPVGQRIKSTVTAGTAYATILTAVFSTVTTFTVQNDSTALDSGLSAVSYGLFNAANPSISAIGVKYDSTATVPSTPASIAQPVQRLDRAVSLFTTSGTAPAFVFTPTQPLPVYATNSPMLVKFHAANGGIATMNVSGLGALNLKTIDASGTKQPATFSAGLISEVVFDGTDLIILNPAPTAAAGGRFLRTTVFTASGTWTKQADVGKVRVIVTGGGAGGNANGTDAGGGGGGGGTAIKTIASPGATETVTIGAGGASAANGAISSFGAWCSGLGGITGNAVGRNGGAGGAASSGDINMPGGGGNYGGNGGGGQIGGAGGSSYVGGGAPSSTGSAVSTGVAAAANSGGGGSGALTVGGVGGSGLVIVEEYS